MGGHMSGRAMACGWTDACLRRKRDDRAESFQRRHEVETASFLVYLGAMGSSWGVGSETAMAALSLGALVAFAAATLALGEAVRGVSEH
jgi:hypothetical protein